MGLSNALLIKVVYKVVNYYCEAVAYSSFKCITTHLPTHLYSGEVLHLVTIVG